MNRVETKTRRKGASTQTVPCQGGCGHKVDRESAGYCRPCFKELPEPEQQRLLGARTGARRAALREAEEAIHQQRCAEDLARFLANCWKCREPLTVPHRRDCPLT